jgi:hypothetical protein
MKRANQIDRGGMIKNVKHDKSQTKLSGIGVYQILASRRAPCCCPVPLTRRDLYGNHAGEI